MYCILYEYPLNETIRNYLKLEKLFDQVHCCDANNINTNYSVFYTALFSIIDDLERKDIRGDLIKELEKLEQHLLIWSKYPNIDRDVLQLNLSEVIQCITQLKVNQQSWWQLKEDKLLSSLKQRFVLQGGSALFDLPQLRFWLNLPTEKITTDITHWRDLLTNIEKSLTLVLKFLRKRADFKDISTDSGFYQDNGEGVQLLRIKLNKNAPHYPTISGNKFRYSIHFMLPCKKAGKRYSNQATHFQLARC